MRHDIPALSMQKELADCAGAQLNQAYSPTLRERLLGQKADLTQRLANVNAALEVLDKMPDFETAMNIIGKVY